MRKITFLLFFVSWFGLQAQEYSRLKVWLDPITSSVLADHGFSFDHGTVKQGVFFITDIDRETRSWMDQAGVRYDVIHEDVQEHYRNRTESVPRGGGRSDCGSTSSDTVEIPENFDQGSMGGFYTYDEFIDHLDLMHALYPDLISQREAIDTFLSHEGRPIYFVKISDNVSAQEAEPEILYTAIHHAREPQSLTQLIFYMWYLLENYGSDAEVTRLVDNTQMFFIPMVNPDGYIRNEITDPNGGGMWRKNRRINGNGSFGVDLNRNYGYQWGFDNFGSSPNPNSETYRGTAPFSEPETRAVKWLCEQHGFGLSLNYHAFGNYLIYPWGTGTVLTPDSNVFIAFAERMTAENNYVFGTGFQTVGYYTNGDSDDWMYGEQLTKGKMFSMTPEVGNDNDGFWPAQSRITPLSQENVLPNLLVAHYAGNYATIEDDSPAFLSQLNGTLDADAVRLGLTFDAPYVFKIIPVSTNLNSVGNSVSFSSMDIAETEDVAFTYALDPSIELGDEIVYDLVAEFDGFSVSNRFSKFYGEPNVAVSNSGSMDGIDANTAWGPSQSDFVSALTSMADSPQGVYASSFNNELHFSEVIDLENADQAFIRFFAKWEIEAGWDYAQISAAIDGENDWIPLCGLYTKEGSNNQDEGQPIWDGFQNEWVKELVGLNDFVGQKIRLKFSLISDQFVEYDGYYFDDLEVVYTGDTSTTIEKIQEASWNVYPNPVGQVLHFDIPSDEKIRLAIFDLTGAAIQNKVLESTSFSTSGLEAGTYFFELSNGDHREVHRVVVLR